MPINLDHPFKGRQHPGDLIILCYAYACISGTRCREHVAELAVERGVEVDASCICALGSGVRARTEQTLSIPSKAILGS
jgi:hypothetical protein